MRLSQRASALFVCFAFAGCGGGGSTTPKIPKSTVSNAPQGSGKLALSITVPTPAKTAQVKKRSPQFVSPATKSVAIKVAGVTTNIDLASGATGCASDYTKASISEIPVGAEPRGMAIGPDHNVYFVEDAGGGIGKIAAGVYTNFSTGSLQNSLIVGGDGYFWITNVFSGTIGHLKTDWSDYGQFGGMPQDQYKLALATDNSVWFNTFTGSPNNALYHVDAVGNYVPADTIATQYQVTDITTGPDGAIWAAEQDTTHGAIARVAKVAGTWTLTNEFPLPGPGSRALFSPSGLLWIVSDDGSVHTMTTSGVVSSMPSLGGGSDLQMSFDAAGSLWLPETNINKIARVTSTGAITEFAIPTASSDPWGIVAAPDNSIYFTERGPSQLGHMQFPVACSTVATVPAGSATVTITAYDATGGAGGSGNPLSTETVPVTVPANSTTTLNFVLNGIVNNATIAADPNFNPGCSSSGSYPLTLEATDISGNIIVGPGGYADQSGNALTFTLATSDTSGRSTIANGTIAAPAATPAPALNWTGSTLDGQTITGTVSGGTIAGSIYPAVIPGACT